MEMPKNKFGHVSNFLLYSPLLGLESIHICALPFIPLSQGCRNKPSDSKSTELRDQSVSQS